VSVAVSLGDQGLGLLELTTMPGRNSGVVTKTGQVKQALANSHFCCSGKAQ